MKPFDRRDRVKEGTTLHGGRVLHMAHARGYVMVRRPACMPFVISEAEWLALPLFSENST